MLLSLLKSPASDGKAEQLRGESQLREITPAKVFGHSQDRRSPSFHAPQPAPQATNQIFNYVNPFEKLEESSSSHRSSQLGKKPALERADEPADQIRSLARAPTETVSEALNEVADQADKQVQDVLGPTKELASSRSDPKPLSDIEATQTEIKEAVHDAATELCDELKDGKTRKELEKTVPKPVASALQDTAEKIAHEDVADSWENANGVSSATRVFNFPMRPFVSIDVKSTPEIATPVRDEVIMKIASLKKEFDQIDRTLATASPHFIVYAMTKGGGFRVIRQEDGTNKSVFRGSNNQVFNVSASAAANELEVVLATGVNGSVFWTSMPVDENQFREGNLEQRGFVMPPGPSFSDNTSNAQLKTRAKLSCKHVELFAFGRGKNIHLICPFILSSYASEYVATSTREVDTQKYLKEHSLKIATGKAAKDFTFSTDDSAIVTLDKHGWLKFWDLAPIYESLGKNFSPKRSVEVSEPSLSLLVGSSNAKAWPTSVQFVDKDYPISRSQAMRYLLVGLKQNHTVQLWDLALGKAVQELNLPHESETDAICSISYHAKSTIIAIGHPTRNSIFLIHLSAPRYTLPPMNQATYIQRLSQKDGTIPRPDSTAIMSGIREISMSPIGHLRSIDILPPTQMTSEKDAQGDETVFEVYALHSRGVTCMNLKKQDFGWDAKGKVADPNDAQEEGLISIRELQATPAEDISKTSDSSSIREQVKKESEKAVESSRTDDSAQVQRPSETSGQEKVEKADKAEKKKKKKQQQQQQQQEVAEERSGLRADKDSSLNEASRESPSKKATQSVEPLAEQYATQPDFPSRSLDLNGVRSDAASVSAFAGLLNEQLTDLYRRFDEDKRVQEASGAAKQDAILRLVSSTLTENVEKSLTRIITSNVRESVQPSIDSIAADAFQKELPKKVSQQVGSILPNELKAVLSEEVSKALKDAAVLRSISDLVSSKIGGHVEKQFKSILENNFVPRFKNLAAESARKSVAEIEKRVNEQMKVADAQRQGDSAKIDHLTKLTRDLSETVQNMAKAQSDFQKNLLVTQEEMRRQDTAGGQSISTTLRSAPASENPKDVELDTIQGMMLSGKVEDGTIRVCDTLQYYCSVADVFSGSNRNDRMSFLASCSFNTTPNT